MALNPLNHNPEKLKNVLNELTIPEYNTSYKVMPIRRLYCIKTKLETGLFVSGLFGEIYSRILSRQ